MEDGILTKEAKQKIIDQFSGTGSIGKLEVLDTIPEGNRRYKCHTCHLIVDEKPCPNCGETHLAIMCPLDHCECSHGTMAGISYCELCGQPACPECGSHDVVQISRVTGYLQDVSGFNEGKKQELKDRTRYNIG
jgi:RNA polymerase subunit RPABC4/transcription elongation factor Spt4